MSIFAVLNFSSQGLLPIERHEQQNLPRRMLRSADLRTISVRDEKRTCAVFTAQVLFMMDPEYYFFS